MSTVELISTILERRREVVAASLATSAAVDVARSNFSALFFTGAYAALDWLFCPEPLPIPELIRVRHGGRLYVAEEGIPSRYQALDGNFIESLEKLVNSPLIYGCSRVSFDKQTAWINFHNGDELFFRSSESVTWLPQPVIIDNPEILTTLI